MHRINNSYNPAFYFILIVLVLMLLFFNLSGCSTKNTLLEEKQPVKIGINIWAGYAYTFIALDKGFFENNGVNVELVLRKEYSESQNLYTNGDVDGTFGVFTDVILYNAEGNKTKVVFVTDYSDTADVIIANPLYDSLEKLRGKKIGVENINSFSHLFVLKVFEKAGISEVDLQFAVVPSQEITEALDAGKIEAGHTWDPEKIEALAKGYKIVGKAGDVPGLITDVLSFSSKIIQERPDDILAIVKSISEARSFIDTNTEEALQIMTKYEGGTAEEMKTRYE